MRQPQLIRTPAQIAEHEANAQKISEILKTAVGGYCFCWHDPQTGGLGIIKTANIVDLSVFKTLLSHAISMQMPKAP